ncbi:MAG: hypothetical protein HY453_00575 [Parcubacteria group bacterium]|nr:hypothetical protein [Parcubacteria group bacterium]
MSKFPSRKNPTPKLSEAHTSGFTLKLSEAHTSGFTLIVAVIIMTAAFVLIVVLGAKSFRYTSSVIQAQIDQTTTNLLAESCAQKVLRMIVDNSNYPGNETITNPEGDCTLYPIAPGVPADIDIEATIRDHTTRLRVTIDSKTPPNVIKWEKLENF